MVVVVAALLFASIALPLVLGWRLWRLDEGTRLGWLLVVAETAVFMALIVLVARWDMAGIWSRIALPGLVAVATLVSLRRHAGRPWRMAAVPFWRGYGTRVASLAVFGAGLTYVIVGFVASHDPRALTFPLEGGRFVIAQGGGADVLNHHNSHREQRHAIDITAVGKAGLRASGPLPDDPTRYVVFGKTVISPCRGTVATVVDGLPDLSPPTRDRDNPAGNHVILYCDDLSVELAHLRQGSILVEPGDLILAGQPIGQVGNSGNSTEPHLHIHAVDVRTGDGVQMSFDSVIPVRNRVFIR